MHTLARPSRPRQGDALLLALLRWAETPLEPLRKLKLFQDERILDRTRDLLLSSSAGSEINGKDVRSRRCSCGGRRETHMSHGWMLYVPCTGYRAADDNK